MKKISLLVLMFCSAFLVNAQSGFGIKGGVGLSSIRTDAGSLGENIMQSLDTKTGFVGGVWGRIGDKFYLQPELLIASRGGEIEVIPVGGGGPQFVDIKYSNLDLPVLIGFKPLKFLRIMGGPVASFKLSEDKKLKEALGEYTSNTGEAFKQATYGYQLGVGVKLLGMEIDLRKEGSLSDISQLKFASEPQFSQRTSGWQLTVGFKLI